MNIVILHCHLQSGGVTQVIENHVHAITNEASAHRILLVSSSRVSGLRIPNIEHLALDALDYDSPSLAKGTADSRADSIVVELQNRLAEPGIAADDTVLHWHNHSLGKNTALPAAIARLAASGWRQFLQIHDFAEDNRPENYRRLIDAIAAQTPADLDRYLYPVSPTIHYGTLTGGDAEVLRRIGVPADQVHCVPNSVRLPNDVPDHEESLDHVRRTFGLPVDARWCLYPVRGIRRKNVGEFLLFSQLAGESVFAGITLCPETPVERRSYLRWKSIASEVSPRVVFDAADGVPFLTNLAAADFIVSTSVAEGFGMAMLEPWLAGRPVIARDLPSVTGDFLDSGIQLPNQYERLPIPGTQTWLAAAVQETKQAFEQAWSTLPKTFRPDAPSFDVSESTIDFASLVPQRQVAVLRCLSDDHAFRNEVREACASVIDGVTSLPDKTIIQQNQNVIARLYGAEHQASQLLAIYSSLLDDVGTELTTTVANAGDCQNEVSQSRPFYPCRTEWLQTVG